VNARGARIAAVGDVHAGRDSRGHIRPGLLEIARLADVLLLAGDLTQHGDLEEGKVLAAEVDGLPVPVISVLGNHDYHRGEEAEIRSALEAAGVRVLEGESVVLRAGPLRVGVAGVKGFGGGFAGACATEFGEPEMKAFVRTTKRVSQSLETQLSNLDADVRIALTHYSPVEGTLMGERLELFPFLGSYLLGEAIDRAGCSLAIHGHAHRGSECGVTPGGISVRNVAIPVIQHAYRVYRLGDGVSVPLSA
jgi:Icc-related predicted phosphoesterase